LRERWSRNAHRYAQKTPEVRVTADLPLIVQIKRQILHVIVPPVWYTLQVLRAFFYRFYHPILHVGERCPSNLSIAANVALRQAPWKPDFILSMYSDIWLTHPYYWRKDLNIPLPWGGIRFMPFKRDIAGSEGYFRNSSFRGLCFLDELAVDNYGRRDPEKIFEFVPDVANDALPECRLPLVDEMCRLANGRKIVLLCGSIEGRKNVRMFCELSQLADSSQFFFALVGQVHRSTFSVEELSLLSTFIEAEAASTFYRDTYFEDESEMNAVINSADVIFAAYRDFSISSNMLSKAAGFRKPILVSDKYLMGARVKQYGIGFAVPEDSAIGILEGLERVIARPPLIENYLNFCRDSSCDGLSQRLEKFLMKCLKNGSK
jgi:hypothetical protein